MDIPGTSGTHTRVHTTVLDGHKTYISNITDNTYTYISIIFSLDYFLLSYCPHMYFTVILGGTQTMAATRGTDQQGRGVVMRQRSLSGRVHAVQQVWVGPLVLAGVYVRGGHLADTVLQRRCDLRGAAAGAPTFGTVAGAGDILLGLKLPRRGG
jgi:hypothetical protein